MPQKYSQINLSVTDLYAERDRLSWIYRTTALVASWFVLGAYILAPLIFTSASDNLKPTRNAMVTLAVAMLVLGYAALIMTARLSRSLLFLLRMRRSTYLDIICRRPFLRRHESRTT
jgi:hypothetical protein